MDKEKILKAIKACSEFCCGECPYQHLDDPDGYLKLRCIHSLMVDINRLVENEERLKNLNTHPCKICNTGWGSLAPDGFHSCHDTCEKLHKYKETSTNCVVY